MKVAAVVVVLALVGAAMCEFSAEESFVRWMQYHQVSFDVEEFQERFQIFSDNLEFVLNFDADAHTYQVGLNQFAAMSNEEYQRTYLGFKSSQEYPEEPQPSMNPSTAVMALPSEWDWASTSSSTKGGPAVTGVKNQGQCGSCWSFSTTGSTEGLHKISGNTLVGLSEQNLMDCSWSYGNLGCDGGEMTNAFKYIIANDGIDTESSYPYTEKSSKECKYSASNKGATVGKYETVAYGNESDLQTAAYVNPVSVAIDASHISFQLYTSGVYYEPNCSTRQLDHGVLVTGWGVDNGTDYWVVKNSWGVTWGQKGYIWMSRNRNNNCGIASDASYPQN